MSPKSEIYNELAARILMNSILISLRSVRKLSEIRDTIVSILDSSNNTLTYYNTIDKTKLFGIDKINIITGRVSNIEFHLEIEKFIFRNPRIIEFKWEILDGCF